MYFKAQFIALFITNFILKTIFGTLQNNPEHSRIKKGIRKKKKAMVGKLSEIKGKVTVNIYTFL